MKHNAGIFVLIASASATGVSQSGNPTLELLSPAEAAESISKQIVAIQVRKQGFACNKALTAERDKDHPEQKGGWILRCQNANYHVHLIPSRPAHVKLVD